jgi:O-antigen/teichoic acid export membrane protein
MLGAFAATSALNYAFGLAAGWLLAPGDFGLLAFVQTLLLIVGLALNSGVPWQLTKDLLHLSPEGRHGVIRGALIANCGLATAIVIVIGALYVLGPLRLGLERSTILLLTLAACPAMAALAIARSSANGLNDFAAVALLTVTEIGIKVIAGVLLMLLGLGAVGAIAGFTIGAIGGAILGLRYLAVSLAVGWRGARVSPRLRSTFPLFVAVLGLALVLNLDLLALKLVAGDARSAVGLYQAGIILANLPYYVVTAALSPILFARVARMGALDRAAETIGATIARVLVLVLPLEYALILAPDLALGVLFPEAYASGAAGLQLLALGNALMIVVSLLATVFQAVGRANVPATLFAILVPIEALVLIGIVPTRQAAGAATTFVGVALVAASTLATLLVVRLDRLYLRAAGWWLLRYATACGIGAGGAGLVIALGGSGWQALIVAAPIYVASAVALRLLTVPGASAVVSSDVSPIPAEGDENHAYPAPRL